MRPAQITLPTPITELQGVVPGPDRDNFKPHVGNLCVLSSEGDVDFSGASACVRKPESVAPQRQSRLALSRSGKGQREGPKDVLR